MNDPADPVVVAARVAEVFERMGVPYLLGGSLASVVYGEPRATLDVDLVADLDPPRVGPFLAAVDPDFFVDAGWVSDEVARRGSFQLVHRESMIRVDVFVPEWVGFDLWKWEQRRRLDLGHGISLFVTSPEGIALQKLVWFRDGGEVSDRQWRDVLGVLKNQGSVLDLAVMAEQARACGVESLLDRALREAGLR